MDNLVLGFRYKKASAKPLQILRTLVCVRYAGLLFLGYANNHAVGVVVGEGLNGVALVAGGEA